ncbi:MAG: hypothetical protein JWN38_551 [Candidatus Saccharibacteria bacterium]|nr:hypothetical protein [Candidatus Saccharibacteria bacterium]
MPPLGPEFDTFKARNRNRIRAIKSQEQRLAETAHSLLPKPAKPRALRVIKDKIMPPTSFDTPHTPTAYYRAGGLASDYLMSAYFSQVYGGVLFTRLAHFSIGTGIMRGVGPIQPRAIITKSEFFGNPVMPLSEAGHLVDPSALTLTQREAFVQDLTETIDLIRAVVEAEASQESSLPAAN